jgi:hypothetical protein
MQASVYLLKAKTATHIVIIFHSSINTGSVFSFDQFYWLSIWCFFICAQVECRVCYRIIHPLEEIKCSVSRCEQPFHLTCVAEYTANFTAESFRCPQHVSWNVMNWVCLILHVLHIGKDILVTFNIHTWVYLPGFNTYCFVHMDTCYIQCTVILYWWFKNEDAMCIISGHNYRL